MGKYRILGRLGQGGMGVVYRAEDSVLKREVAVKILPDTVASQGMDGARFLREARAAARLHHPNVVTIHDAGREGDVQYFVMELIEGESAQDALDRKGALAWVEATRILEQVCRGLAAAHGEGLVHRDIKPGNIMLCPDGVAKLADFGLVRAIDSSSASLTGQGGILGTPFYMSPEQCRGEKADERSDIYSLGATYYALLCGAPPFVAETPVAVLFAHCSKPVPDPRAVRPDLPEACASIVRKAMAKEAADRYASVAAILKDVERALGRPAVSPADAGVAPTVVRGEPDRTPAKAVRRASAWAAASRPPWVLAGLAAVVVIATLAYPLLRHGTGPQTRNGPASPPASPQPKKGDRADAGPAGRAPSTGGPTVEVVDFPSMQRILDEGAGLPMQGKARAVAFSSDGKWFAAGNFDETGGVRLWSLETRKERPLLWPGMEVHCITFVPKEGLLVAGGVGDIRAFNLSTGDTRTLESGVKKGSVCSIAPIDAGTLAAALLPGEGDEPNFLALADLSSGKSRLFPGGASWIPSLARSRDGHRLVLGAVQGLLESWEVPSMEPKEELSTGLRAVTCVDFSPADGTLAVGGDGSLQTWDLAKSTRLQAWDWSKGEVWCLAFSPDGSVLAAGGSGVTLWDPRSGRRIGVVEGHTDVVAGLAFSPDGAILATASFDKSVRLQAVHTEGSHATPGGR